jgi:FMN phosphatase YigB (HAD superfamily)
MIVVERIPLDKDVYCFEIDDVLYPKRDYLLQVYYLFSNFIAFTEGLPSAEEMTEFMRKTYQHQGEDEVFPLTKETFGLNDEYEENFKRLQANAQLPLKLLLFSEVENLLLSLQQDGKKIAILTKGNPVEQLNKLKYMDWGKFEMYKNFLKVYFIDELRFRNIDPITYIAKDFGVSDSEIHVIEKNK